MWMRPENVQTATNNYTLLWRVHVMTPQLKSIRSIIHLTAGRRLTGSAGLHRVAAVCESVSRSAKLKSNGISIVGANRCIRRDAVSRCSTVVTSHRTLPSLTIGNIRSGNGTGCVGGGSAIESPRILEVYTVAIGV